jgi:uncharacterized protein YlxP (DUF503 family)
MLVGTCRIELYLPDSGSLKGKRQVIKAIKDRIRNRFNVSVAEIDYQDLWQRAALGVAMVSNDARFIDQTLAQVLNVVHQDHRVNVLDYSVEHR